MKIITEITLYFFSNFFVLSKIVYLAMDPFGAGDWSRKDPVRSELEPRFLDPLRARFDMEFERGLGWPADGVTALGVIGGPPGVCGAPAAAAPTLWWVGDGEGAGLIELEEWPSEWREPVDWYIAERRLKFMIRNISVRNWSNTIIR